jgi:carotenoid 1,2-hydratase
MQDDFTDWHWGRCHMDDRVLVYLGTEGCAWASELGADGHDVWTDVSISAVRRRISRFVLHDPITVRVRGRRADGREASFEVDQRRILDDGPFYRRYLAAWSTGSGQRSIGISEFMDATRYRRPWIRPFLRLPWYR